MSLCAFRLCSLYQAQEKKAGVAHWLWCVGAQGSDRGRERGEGKRVAEGPAPCSRLLLFSLPLSFFMRVCVCVCVRVCVYTCQSCASSAHTLLLSLSLSLSLSFTALLLFSLSQRSRPLPSLRSLSCFPHPSLHRCGNFHALRLNVSPYNRRERKRERKREKADGP